MVDQVTGGAIANADGFDKKGERHNIIGIRHKA